MARELDLANDTAYFWGRQGEVSLVYLTAEFAPFSNQQKSDIYFTPRSGPFSGEKDASLTSEAVTQLSEKDVHVIGDVQNPRQLAAEILAWAGLKANP